MALISEDVSTPECLQQAELLTADKIAVVSFLLPACFSLKRAKARASTKENRMIHLAEVIIFGESVLNDRRKGSGKGGTHGTRTSYLGVKD